MTQRGVPLLALVLASAACARLGLPEETLARLQIAFTDAVAATDNADRAYRAAIERTLPHDLAHKMLSAMAAFRECAQQAREAAMHEMREIYKRYNRQWDWIDPLDPTPILPRGLSHADGTRLATIGDRARSQIDTLRTQTNETVVRELSRDQVEALRAAKIDRREHFEQALRAALAGGADPLEQRDLEQTLAHVVSVAEGWY